MERGLIFDEKPAFIFDLGTGYSNVHLNIEQVDEPETDDTTNTMSTMNTCYVDIERTQPLISTTLRTHLANIIEFSNFD